MRLASLLAVPLIVSSTLFAQNTLPGNIAPIRDFYRAGLQRNGIVGSTLVLFDNGQVVLNEKYGRQSLNPPESVDDQTTYHWASVTKTFTGIAIMQLRDRGLLSLDDPLVKYIPELQKVHDPFGPISDITIRQAMSHTNGFRDATWPWHAGPWEPYEPTQWSQLVAMMPYTSVDFAPGYAISLLQPRRRLSRADHRAPQR